MVSKAVLLSHSIFCFTWLYSGSISHFSHSSLSLPLTLALSLSRSLAAFLTVFGVVHFQNLALAKAAFTPLRGNHPDHRLAAGGFRAAVWKGQAKGPSGCRRKFQHGESWAVGQNLCAFTWPGTVSWSNRRGCNRRPSAVLPISMNGGGGGV